ncbi:MAG: hypothetical protein ACQESR_28510 [Planctomycetota bacterium]
MNHHTTADFWDCYARLPEAVQRLAGEKYNLLRTDPWHPSLHFKRVGRLWSVRVGIGYRALAMAGDDGPVWFWIGSHAEYDRMIHKA